MVRPGQKTTAGLAVVAVLAVVAGVAVWLARSGNDTHTAASGSPPPLLHLMSDARSAPMGAEPARGAGTFGGGYVLDGTLPDGTPDDAPVWRPAPATADDAANVAAALGLSGSPTSIDGGWVLRGGSSPTGGNLLTVRADGSWSYGLDCMPDRPIDNEDVNVGCAAATAVSVAPPVPADGAGGGSTGGGSTGNSGSVISPPQPSPGPSESDARAAAAPIFSALGFGSPALTVYAGDPTATVEASPQVGGLDVVGWTTSVQIDGSGAVAGGYGWLTKTERGDSYPLVSAQRAFELLKQQPRPMFATCVQPDTSSQPSSDQPDCQQPEPTSVTGAHLGLTLDYDGNGSLLVPAWLFEIKDQSQPVAQIAVDPAYVAAPVEPTPEDPGTPASVPGGAPDTVAPVVEAPKPSVTAP